ncbi:HCaRG protein-domain-containing protein [Baffinella frigidus]|nr:HCaRG protein-domain-containing protein [Cryptophyta sp. CCMP2293]
MRRAVALGESDAELSKRLSLAGVNTEQAVAVCEALRTRLPELRAAMLADGDTLSGSYLADFDWKVNLTVASSSAASMSKPAMQLALYVADGDGARREVMLEMDEAELDTMIAAVGAARNALTKIPA